MNVSTPRSHSPLPWSIDPEGEFETSIEDADGKVICRVTGGEHEANAAFIVRACNNAQRLADALKLHLANGGPLSDPVSRKQANGKAREALAQWEAGQ